MVLKKWRRHHISTCIGLYNKMSNNAPVDPRAPLAPSAQGSPGKELEYGQHASQRPPILAQHDTRADDDQAVNVCLARSSLPVAAHLCQKVVASWAGFAECGVVGDAIVPCCCRDTTRVNKDTTQVAFNNNTHKAVCNNDTTRVVSNNACHASHRTQPPHQQLSSTQTLRGAAPCPCC